MKISASNYSFKSALEVTPKSKKTNFLDKFHTYAKNTADMTDTIVVPRTIFKGYLGIMAGTTLVTLGGIATKMPKLSKVLSVAGLLTSMYGTYAFVRPFIIKDTKGVEKTKTTNHNIKLAI